MCDLRTGGKWQKNQLKDMRVAASGEQEIKSGDTESGATKDSVTHLIKILAPLNSISNNTITIKIT